MNNDVGRPEGLFALAPPSASSLIVVIWLRLAWLQTSRVWTPIMCLPGGDNDVSFSSWTLVAVLAGLEMVEAWVGAEPAQVPEEPEVPQG